MTQDNSAYPKSYGAWAGNERGHPPDFERCCQEVHGDHLFHQCGNKRGQGPGQAYCGIHNPEKVKARRAKADAKYDAERNYRNAMAEAWPTIQRIADGQNDPRGLCVDLLAKVEATRAEWSKYR